MNKLSRIITSTLFFAIGAGIVFVGVSSLFHASDWIMFASSAVLVVIGLVFVAMGWLAVSGRKIRDVLDGLISGTLFWP